MAKLRGGEWQGGALENYNANNVAAHVRTLTPPSNRHTHTHQHAHTPFLEEMSLARSSLRLARESASSSARGNAFSWGAERLCWTWDSSKVWESASRRAARHRQKTRTAAAAGDDDDVRLERKKRGLSVKDLPSEDAETERWPSLRSWEERGSPKQLVHRTASTTHTHSPAVI